VAVTIRQAAVDDMVTHARSELPNECCGLLVGSADEVLWSVRARNLRPSASRFLIDPETHFAALRRAREAGLAVMGAYHSHPETVAVPSARDLLEASYPEFLYVIVSLCALAGGHDLRAYRLVDGNFRAVELVLGG
jgi:proteasome lid subunit RPN8/RPN11